MKSGKFVMMLALILAASQVRAADKHPFKATGLYTETCSCKAPCACEMVGLNKGCIGVGALQLSGGSYDGKDLAGVKAAYATEPGNWVVVYVQAASAEQREAAAAFLTAVFSGWGKVEAVKDARIDISGDGGNYIVSVDDGKIMKYQTAVVLGADKKTPILHENVADTLNKTFKQGLSVSCTFKDGDHEINLDKGRNAFFNDTMDASGEI